MLLVLPDPEAVHVDHHLHPRVQLDPLDVGEHPPGEAVHHQHLGRDPLLVHQPREDVHRGVHVGSRPACRRAGRARRRSSWRTRGRAPGARTAAGDTAAAAPAPPPRCCARSGCPGSRSSPALSAHRATLSITAVPRRRRYFPPPPGLSCATVAIRCSAGITRPAAVGRGPHAGGALEPGQHAVGRDPAEDAHAGAAGCAVVGDDAVGGDEGAGKRLGKAGNRPAGGVGRGELETEVAAAPVPARGGRGVSRGVGAVGRGGRVPPLSGTPALSAVGIGRRTRDLHLRPAGSAEAPNTSAAATRGDLPAACRAGRNPAPPHGRSSGRRPRPATRGA